MASASPERRSRIDSEASSSFRLRHVLGLLALAGLVAWIYPRGSAAWELHNLAVTYADYGLCMVGPTGPELLRTDSAQFVELTRRRVITASAEERPFLECQELALRMQLPSSSTRLHGAKAKDFAEYHHTPGSRPRSTVQGFAPEMGPLEKLQDRAWPFVRTGVDKLMRPSSHAKEAAHPARVPVPGWGSGLPAQRFFYRSTAAFGNTFVVALGSGANARVLMSKNQGRDWQPGGRGLASDLQDRCVADDEGRAFTLSRLNDGRRIVLSQGPFAAPQVAVLSDSEMLVASLSCDASALVAALVEQPDDTGHRPMVLRLCPFRRPCQDLASPDPAGAPLYYPADVARIDGDIVIAKSAGGITRVASSRDGGRSWMPWIVAFDALTSGSAARAPHRLLVAADRLLLYSGSNGSEPYPLLVSDDHGASFFSLGARDEDQPAPQIARAPEQSSANRPLH